jgi:cell division protein ZapA (FtsZ GTPase activity inhibitor)
MSKNEKKSLLRIEIQIKDFRTPIVISKEEEDLTRKAAKYTETCIENWEKLYPEKDFVDIMYIAAYMISKELHRLKENKGI